MNMDAVRKSVIAGSWYPGDPSVLRRDIESYFNSEIKIILLSLKGTNDNW